MGGPPIFETLKGASRGSPNKRGKIPKPLREPKTPQNGGALKRVPKRGLRPKPVGKAPSWGKTWEPYGREKSLGPIGKEKSN